MANGEKVEIVADFILRGSKITMDGDCNHEIKRPLLLGRKAVTKLSCVLSPCLLNFYAEYIMGNFRLDESQAGIKIAGRNINNLRYVDNTNLGRK